jgi:hypothetical protein
MSLFKYRTTQGAGPSGGGAVPGSAGYAGHAGDISGPDWDYMQAVHRSIVAANNQQRSPTPRDKIMMRLDLPEGRRTFDYIHAQKSKSGDRYFVMILHDDKPVVIEDEASLFPSDALITQLRLILP